MTGSLPFSSPAASYANRELAPLPSLAGVKKIGFDWETDLSPNWRRKGYGFSYYVDEGCKGYVSLFHPDSVNYDPANVRNWMNAELRGKTIVCAEAKHEVAVTRNFGVSFEDLGCEMRDVFFPAALLDEKRRQINLNLLAWERLKKRKIELTGTDLWPIHERPADQIADYGVQDSRLAMELDIDYEDDIAAQELNRVLAIENAVIFANEEMERNGMYLDVEKLARWQREVRAEIEKRHYELHRLTGMNINPGSGDDMRRLFYHLNLEIPIIEERDKETGEITKKESFAEELLVEVNHPVVTIALEIRQLSSLDSKFLTKYLNTVEPDGRIRYRLNQVGGDEYGTRTGRYSCGGGEGNNNIQQVSDVDKQPEILQRWPVRELFIPPPGRVWVSSDASQIEFRFFAHYSQYVGSRRLIDAYNNDSKTDFHALVTEWTGLIRKQAKNVNFAKLFGAGLWKISKMIHKNLVETAEVCEKYDTRFPEAKQLIDMASETASVRRYVKTLYGRRRRYDPAKGDDRFYSALNFIFQGGAADVLKLKIAEVYRERKRLGLTMRAPVHDEIDGDLVDSGMASELGAILNRQTTPMAVPILWETKTGPNWQSAH